ncbi:hypothetical protein PLICRDRAFT_177466 [Plicaturopsis crispa FD-325 SS-3]|nr:hypothetical protein PLICRDRAFT_177466 [Plicaturopsis crispa FD-325 SS-3]
MQAHNFHDFGSLEVPQAGQVGQSRNIVDASSSCDPPPILNVPVFAGQGTSAADSRQTREQALRDAASPSGSLLLSSCFEAFHREIDSLTAAQIERLGIRVCDFTTPDTLLSFSSDRYLHNALLSGTTLFLIQSLRYLAFVESTLIPSSSFLPLHDGLKANKTHGLGVLGFSSGILCASVVATSTSTLSYISHSVEAFRLAFWIGFRTQNYRTDYMERITGIDSTHSWSLVFLGLSHAAAHQAIIDFQASNSNAETLTISAVMTGNCVTISGRPDTLAAFSKTVPAATVHETTVDSLYHSPLHVGGLEKEVLEDIDRRNIRFPTMADIEIPLRSSSTGLLIERDSNSRSLVGLVTSMLLTEPVRWDSVHRQLSGSIPRHGVLRLLNIGPGAGLVRGMARAFPQGQAECVDLTASKAPLTAPLTTPKQEPIAIVGMSVNMPGAPDTAKLWEVIEQGINTVSPIPDERFKVSDYNYPADAASTRTMRAHTGNFIDGADEFDHQFFRISPREAKSMDPQQRILLHTAYHALENSGYVPNATASFRQENIGCFIGVATNDYVQNLRNAIDVYYSPGTLQSFLAGRVSYALQLSGPSIVMDTACSSSTVAIHQACRALMNGDCNAALAGGVNIITSPDMFIGLDRGHFLSPTGQCKTFDESADGYSRGEGAGMFVLKRLSDALAENDNILGVIRAAEVNQSGLAHSITHPHAPTQAALFRRTLDSAGIDPDRVSVVEAHGTGTKAGDPDEVASLRSVFGGSRTSSNPLHLSSIKANIGHLEAASGAAGLAKLLLMFRNRVIPRQISLKTLSTNIEPLHIDHTVIATQNTPWTTSSPGATRVALLNNFGAAGSNAALLVEEHPSGIRVHSPPGMQLPFGLSAKTEVALEELRARYLAWLQSEAAVDVPLSDIAYTMTSRRQIYGFRLAFTASSKEELIDRLRDTSPVCIDGAPGKVVFVFSGQGSQFLGMGRSLYHTCPLFRQNIDKCHNFLLSSGFPGILSIVDAPLDGSGLSLSDEIEAYQAAIFSVQYSLAELWLSWGLTPVAVLGHSIGEYAALVVAGVLSRDDALKIVATRARLMVQKCAMRATSMLAVNLAAAAIEVALMTSSSTPSLSIACYNGPEDCVVAGPLEELARFKAYLDAKIFCRNTMLTVPFGYHTSAMQPVVDALAEVAAQCSFRAPIIPIVSNVHGDVVMPGDSSIFNAQYFPRHCLEPVKFDQGMKALVAIPGLEDVAAWIELGPGGALGMMKSSNSWANDPLLLSSLRRQKDAWATMATCLARIYTSSIANIKWRNVYSHIPSVLCVDLPSYAFARSKFWIRYQDDSGTTQTTASLNTSHPLIRTWIQFPSQSNGRVARFQTPICDLAKFIEGHTVGGSPLCPASVYIELAFAGIELARLHIQSRIEGDHILLREIDFMKPLVYDEAVPRLVEITVTLGVDSGTFSVQSRADASGRAEEPGPIHARGEFRLRPVVNTATKFHRAHAVLDRQMKAVLRRKGDDFPKIHTAREAYEDIFHRVVDYARDYRTMQSVTVDPSGMEGYATVKLPSGYDDAAFHVHPVFIDSLLQVAGFVANTQGGQNDAFICYAIGSVKVLAELIDNDRPYTVYCCNSWIPEEGLMLADAYAVQIERPSQIVAHLKGIRFRRLRLDSLKRGLERASGNSSVATSPVASFKQPTFTSMALSAQDFLPRLHGIVHTQIVTLVADVCGINPIELDVDADLSSFGVDSLMTIEIASRLQEAFPRLDLPVSYLADCCSITDIISQVSSRTPNNVSCASSPTTLVFDGQHEPSSDKTLDFRPIIASVLGVGLREIDDAVDFEALGLDSLTSIEALHAFDELLGLDLPADFFVTYPNAAMVENYISSHLRTGHHNYALTKLTETRSTSDFMTSVLRLNDIPISLQQSSCRARAPLFLIHDGSGLVNHYKHISSLNRNVWGIPSTHFTTGQTWSSLETMASTYARCILDIVASTGEPILLGGWSFGGVVAFEVARQLLVSGVIVKGVVLIDSPSPSDRVVLSDKLLESAISLQARTMGSQVGAQVRAQFETNTRLLDGYHPRAGRNPPLAALCCREGFQPPDVPDVPPWLSNRCDLRTPLTGWEALVRSAVKGWDIPGHHFQPFQPQNIHEVSCRIADACAYLESL